LVRSLSGPTLGERRTDPAEERGLVAVGAELGGVDAGERVTDQPELGAELGSDERAGHVGQYQRGRRVGHGHLHRNSAPQQRIAPITDLNP
jgi:hypothetical protein